MEKINSGASALSRGINGKNMRVLPKQVNKIEYGYVSTNLIEDMKKQ